MVPPFGTREAPSPPVRGFSFAPSKCQLLETEKFPLGLLYACSAQAKPPARGTSASANVAPELVLSSYSSPKRRSPSRTKIRGPMLSRVKRDLDPLDLEVVERAFEAASDAIKSFLVGEEYWTFPP